MRMPDHNALPAAHGTVEAPHCFLVAPSRVLELASVAGLKLAGAAETLPAFPPTSGLLVCLPDTSVYALPPGWSGVWGRNEEPPTAGWVPLPSSAVYDTQVLVRALRTAENWRCERFRMLAREDGLAVALKMVNEIGIALSAERDPLRLCGLILSHARRLVAADAGTLYLIEKDAQNRLQLRFVLAQNDSVEAPWATSLLPVDPNSVAGAVALRGEVVVLDDVYALSPDSLVRHDRSFDQRFGYRTRSVVGLPLVAHDGEVLGVLQLINHKPLAGIPMSDPTLAEEALPFDPSDVELLCSLASQAAASLENSRLQEDIERLFESFVRGIVTAIERRDPTTSGHSFRVADGTVALARRLERYGRGRWAGARFSCDELRELRYAALLHDVGKVGVREQILTKAKKLHGDELVTLRHRFVLARLAHRARCYETWLQAALKDPQGMQQRLPRLYDEMWHELAKYEEMLQTILQANEPTILAEGDFSALWEIREHSIEVEGRRSPLLTDKEIRALSLSRGSLTPEERVEIESHVTFSYDFLATIPWTRDLARVPELAYGHHERLDGSGYPLGLKGESIPLGTRIITVADIFDALTARDRPYKKAVPLERSLAILEDEARQGKLDADLVQLWIESRAWEDIGTY